MAKRIVLTLRDSDVVEVSVFGSFARGEGTVQNYLSSALSKLNAGNWTEAARLTEQYGWI